MYQWCGFKSRRGKNQNLTALKSNSNTVWFNFLKIKPNSVRIRFYYIYTHTHTVILILFSPCRKRKVKKNETLVSVLIFWCLSCCLSSSYKAANFIWRFYLIILLFASYYFLRYILTRGRILQRQELDAFLAMSVSPLLHDVQTMQDLKV